MSIAERKIKYIIIPISILVMDCKYGSSSFKRIVIFTYVLNSDKM